MIGVVDIECQALNPNMPLHPLRAFVNSPSSIRVRNVPRKIGKWNINKVTIVAIYPDSTSQTAQCVLTGGVWVGTIEGSTTAGTLTQGYSIIADGVDENGNDVTGYVLGKGDVVIMKADGVPEPEPATIFVKLQDDGTGAEDGDIYPTENGYMIQQNGEAHQLGTPFEQITAYVDSQVSSKADLSTLNNFYTKSDTSSAIEIQDALDQKQPIGNYLTAEIEPAFAALSGNFLTAHQSLADYYTKSETSSAIEIENGLLTKADLSTVENKRDIIDMGVRGQPTTPDSWFMINTTYTPWYDQSNRWESVAGSITKNGDVYTVMINNILTSFTLTEENKYAVDITIGSDKYHIAGYVDTIATTQQLETKADQNSLSNYYPVSGGLINGDISWKSPFYTGGIKGYLGSSATQGIIVLYDTQENKDIYITPSNFQGVSSNIVYWPTKSGTFAVDADLSALHQDYIYDNVGNSLSANREVHVINEISGLVFYDSIQLGYVDYLDENDIWQNTNHTVRISANAPESEYAWHIFVSDFKYDEYITINAEGDFNVGESINWSSGNYYYVRNCVFTRVDGLVKKTTLEHLATQEWVLAQLSALEARIAALEGN